MHLLLAQLKISKAIDKNLENVLNVLKNTKKDQWVIFPEGMLSGYYPEENNFISNIERKLLEASFKKVQEVVKENGCVCLMGSVTFESNFAYNSTLIFHGNEIIIYNKCNLSTLDRNHFAPGNAIQSYNINGISFGVQMCRENAFPEQWIYLKKQGVQVVFHTNNAIAKYDGKRKHLLISRAMENQIFIVSVNTVAENGPLPSMVINPYGEVIYESPLHKEDLREIEINLDESMNDYLKQKREDLVKVIEG